MTLRLKSITFNVSPKIPGMRAGALTTIDCDSPHGSLVDWSISVRGQSVFFISPPGWDHRFVSSPHMRDTKGPVQIHEVPRQDATLSWTGDAADIEAALKSMKYDSGPLRPFTPPVEESDEASIPAHQLGD